METKPAAITSVLTDGADRTPALARSVASSVVVSLVGIAGVAWVVGRLLDLGETFPLRVMLAFGLGASVMVVLARKHIPSRTFGSANRVTLARAALTALLLALIAEEATPAAAWFAAITAFVIVVLDGVDGWLARRRSETGVFGARFDMETDAMLILGCAALAWRFGKAGPWILAAGLMRYVFVGSGYLLPWMRRSLPESRRRQTVCVVQALSLIVCLAPVVTRPMSDVVALAGLALLGASFAIDVGWLARERLLTGSESSHHRSTGVVDGASPLCLARSRMPLARRFRNT